MSIVLYPSSIVCTINRPLDDKTNTITMAERDAIPFAQRYKGMVVVVQNVVNVRPQLFWLPTENLTNTGWEEIEVNSTSNVFIPNWAVAISYFVGQVVVYDGVLYRCKTAHTSPAIFYDMNWDVLGSGASKEYKHTQTIASAVWNIQHNLNTSNRGITIFAIDITGEQIIGYVDLSVSTNNLLVYKFSESLAGEAYIRL